MSGQAGLFDPRGPLFDNPRPPNAGEREAAERLAGPRISRGLDEGRARGAKALRKVDRTSPWVLTAESVIGRLAVSLREFTSDEVWAELDRCQIRVPAEQRRSIGAAFKALQARGTIVATEAHRLSKRVECHGRPVRVWRLTDLGPEQ